MAAEARRPGREPRSDERGSDEQGSGEQGSNERGFNERGSGEHPSDGQLSYEELVDVLEQLVARIGDPRTPIEDAAALYEQALRVRRAAAERLELIASRFEAGEPGVPGPDLAP